MITDADIDKHFAALDELVARVEAYRRRRDKEDYTAGVRVGLVRQCLVLFFLVLT